MLKTAPINQAALLKINKNIQKYSPYPEKVKLIAVTKNLKFSSIKSSYENQIFNILMLSNLLKLSIIRDNL